MTAQELIDECANAFFEEVARNGLYRERDVGDHVSEWIGSCDIGNHLEDKELLERAEAEYRPGSFPDASSISAGLAELAAEGLHGECYSAITSAASDGDVEGADEVSGGPPDNYLQVDDLFVVIDDDGDHVVWKEISVCGVRLWITCDDEVDSAVLDMAKAVADGRGENVSDLAGEEGQDQGRDGLRQGKDAD